MSTPLDVPDGMQVTSTFDGEYGQCLEFYTGRWPIKYSKSEVVELIDALNGWLGEQYESPTEPDPEMGA